MAGAPTTVNWVAEHAASDDAFIFRLDQSQLLFELRPEGLSNRQEISDDLEDSSNTLRSVTVRYDPDSGRFDPRTGVLSYQVRELIYKDHDYFGAITPQPPVDPRDRSASAKARLAHGLALRAAEDLAGARADIEAAISSGQLNRPQLALAYRNRGALSGRQATLMDPGEAQDRLLLATLADYQRWRRLEPHDSRADSIIATVLAALGAYDEAIARYRAIADRDPDHLFWPLIEVELIQRNNGEYDKALATLDEIAKRAGPQEGMAYHYHRGRTLIALTRYEEAIVEFTQGLKGQPDYAYAYFGRACAHSHVGHLQDALDDQVKGRDLVAEDAANDSARVELTQDLARAEAVLNSLRLALGQGASADQDAPCHGYFAPMQAPRPRSPLLTAKELE